MDKYQSTTKSAQQVGNKEPTASIVDVHDNIIRLDYPRNVELSQSFMEKQDAMIRLQYYRYHSRSPQLIIQLDGISDLSPCCKTYIQMTEHQNLYDSIAFVISKGNMSVLERHYLEQLLANQLQNRKLRNGSHYPIGIFSDNQTAENWLASRPGSHWRH